MKKAIASKIVTVISLVLCLLINSSCKKTGVDNREGNNFFRLNNNSKYKFTFPDTIIVNKKYHGGVKYKNDLDSCSTKIGANKGTSRYILLSYLKSKTKFNDIQEIEGNKELDTVMASRTNYIKLSNISFSEKGVNYINGIISDVVILDDFYENGNSNIITDKTLITHKFVVIDSL